MKTVKIDGVKVNVKENKDFDKDFAYDGGCPKCESDANIDQYGNCYDMDSQQLECGDCGCKFEIFTNGWDVGVIDDKTLESVILEEEVRKLLKAIDDNTRTLWTPNLEDVCNCVIIDMEDIEDLVHLNKAPHEKWVTNSYKGISKEYDKLAELVNYKTEEKK